MTRKWLAWFVVHPPDGKIPRITAFAFRWCVLFFALAAAVAPLRADGAATSSPARTLTAWTTDTGLPAGEVLSISQDLEGYLWLGMTTGLVRFDGFRFVPWGSRGERPLGAQGVPAVSASRDGTLWIGLNGEGGVARIREGVLITYSAADTGTGPSGPIAALLEDRRGTVWAGGRDGLFMYTGGRWSAVRQADGFSGADVYSLYEDRSGRLWVATMEGVYRGGDGSFELHDAASTNVQSFAEDRSGGLWVTDTHAVVRRLDATPALRFEAGVRLPASGWRLLNDRRGQLWVAALGGGLLLIDRADEGPAVVERFPYEHRIAGSPRALFEDRHGNVWVGMRGGGLLRLAESDIQADVPLDGLTNDGVRAAAAAADGSVWIATGHSLNRYDAGAHAVYSLPQTMALHVDRHGVMWAATAHGIGRVAGGRFEPVSASEQVRWGRITSVAVDDSGVVWLCSSQQGLIALNGGEVSFFDGEPDVARRPCTATYVDRQGRLWVGFAGGGVALREDGMFRSLGEADGLGRGRVMSIVQDGSGMVWVGTSAAVSRYDDGRFTSLTSVNGPIADVVPTLVEDGDGYLWLGVHGGSAVIRFHPREMDRTTIDPARQIEYALYDGSDGMQGELQWLSGATGVRAGDGRLWFATGLGVAVLDPRTPPRTPRPSSPRIEAVSADGRRIDPRRGTSLPSGTSALRVEYGATSLSAASKLRFRYMLEGHDADWRYAGTSREATYAALPAGAYRFRASATTDGQWTEAAVWDFLVPAPFYRRPWFVTLEVLALAMIVGVAWWLRLRSVRRQYALVFAERARVSREIHDTLLQSLGAIGLELETIATQVDASPAASRDALRGLRRQVGHALREARESIWELRDTSMETHGLADSLRRLADTAFATKGVRVDVSVAGRPHRSSIDVDTQLFRIAQEAINNAIRHGRATQIDVMVEYRNDRLAVTVSDNGCGFAADERTGVPDAGEHLGILSMRERAARIRGRVAIASGPGKGTTIEAWGPLAAD